MRFSQEKNYLLLLAAFLIAFVSYRIISIEKYQCQERAELKELIEANDLLCRRLDADSLYVFIPKGSGSLLLPEDNPDELFDLQKNISELRVFVGYQDNAFRASDCYIVEDLKDAEDLKTQDDLAIFREDYKLAWSKDFRKIVKASSLLSPMGRLAVSELSDSVVLLFYTPKSFFQRTSETFVQLTDMNDNEFLITERQKLKRQRNSGQVD